jgi:hypothetical protein
MTAKAGSLEALSGDDDLDAERLRHGLFERDETLDRDQLLIHAGNDDGHDDVVRLRLRQRDPGRDLAHVEAAQHGAIVKRRRIGLPAFEAGVTELAHLFVAAPFGGAVRRARRALDAARHAPFAGAVQNVMQERVHARFAHVRIVVEITLDREMRGRVAILAPAVAGEMLDWPDRRKVNVAIGVAIEGLVEIRRHFRQFGGLDRGRRFGGRRRLRRRSGVGLRLRVVGGDAVVGVKTVLVPLRWSAPATFGDAEIEIVLERIHAAGAHVGIIRHIPGGVEIRVRAVTGAAAVPHEEFERVALIDLVFGAVEIGVEQAGALHLVIGGEKLPHRVRQGVVGLGRFAPVGIGFLIGLNRQMGGGPFAHIMDERVQAGARRVRIGVEIPDRIECGVGAAAFAPAGGREMAFRRDIGARHVGLGRLIIFGVEQVFVGAMLGGRQSQFARFLKF